MFLRKACTFIRNVISGGNDVSYQTCRFECDSAADLPVQNQTDYMIDIGSEAHDIYNNATYMMDSSGTWQLQQAGTAAYTKAETDALLSDKITAPEAIDTVYGTGEVIPSGTTSLDGYMTAGIYYSGSAITPSSDAFRLEVKYTSGSAYPLQFVYPLNSSGYYYERAYFGGEWKAWKRVEPFGCVGSNIPDNSDLFTLPVGRYYKTSHVSSTYVAHLPSDLTSSAIIVEVLNTVGTNRRMIRLYQATQGDFATWYQALETGSGYGSWYKYTGTAV